MKIQKLWMKGYKTLSEAGIENARLDAGYILEWVLKCSHSELLLHPEREVAEADIKQYSRAIERRSLHEPLQYITGEQEFMGYSFQVNENVLIPRQDTEVLVETVLNSPKAKMQGCECRILDLCCGSGCIGISLWKQMQKRPEIYAKPLVTLADISKEALQVAGLNKIRLDVEAELIESDLFDKIGGRYDIIVSNPPYIKSQEVGTLMPEVLNHEPRLALDGAEDGLKFYRTITKQAMQYLEDTGYLFFEIGYNQAEDVRNLLADTGFYNITVVKDLAGLNRVIYAGNSEDIQEV